MTKLLTLDETLNEFSYGQALLFYKEDIDAQKKEKISAIINNDFEKDIIVDSNANPQTISYRTIWSYLNEEFWNPIKIRKSLF